MTVLAFIANNCLICSSSSSPSTGVLTDVNMYHQIPSKAATFPRQLCQQCKSFTEPPSSRSCLPASLHQRAGQTCKKELWDCNYLPSQLACTCSVVFAHTSWLGKHQAVRPKKKVTEAICIPKTNVTKAGGGCWDSASTTLSIWTRQ